MPLIMKSVIGEEEVYSSERKRFRKLATDAHGSLHDFYIGHVLDDGHICLLRVRKQSNKNGKRK